MEKTLISFNVPNLITVWLMLAIGFLVLTLVLQKVLPPSGASASGAGGY